MPQGLKTYRLAIGLVCLAGFGFYLVISVEAAGYCGEKGRSLSDQEFMEIAVRSEIPSGKMQIDESDSSIRSFHVIHPHCCRVNRTASPFLDRRLGINVVEVDMYYRVNDQTLKKQLGAEYYEEHFEISACGKVLRTYGTGIEKKYLPTGFE